MNTDTIEAPQQAAKTMLRTHELKIWPEYFDSLERGERTAEIRPNDRDFQAGDTLYFREWDPKTTAYTGRHLERLITFVFPGPFYAGDGVAAVPSGYAILSLKDPARQLGTLTPRAPYDCLANLKPGEPYFVLRGQDRLASDLVREWASFAEIEGTPMAKVEDARRIATEMELWPNRKSPD